MKQSRKGRGAGRTPGARPEPAKGREGWRRVIGVLLALGLLGAGIKLGFGWVQSRRLTGAAAMWSRAPTFHRDVAPIVYSRCSGCHHPGEAAPFNLLNYADVAKHARQIAEVTSRRIMPPWLPEPGYGEFLGQRSLSEAQIQLIQRWVRQGAVEGDRGDAPPPPSWREGWQLGKPDLIVQLPEPYPVPAEGRDIYRTFVIPIPLASRGYVRSVELLPGNARAVHHAFMFIDPTRESRRRDAQDAEPGFPGLHTPPTAQTPPGHFLSWQPGKLPILDPEDLAWPLETNCDLVLQMHLRPSGKREWVQPAVGFYFTAAPRSARTPFKFGLWSHEIDIPAGEPDWVVRESDVLPVDVEVLKVLPHAHYLGRELQGVATLPDGTQRWLFWIRRWDFNWQGDYAYVQPLFLPKGTTVSMRYHFDNSAHNPRNPNQPPQRVRYGLNSTDEMAELWLQVLPRNTNDLAILERDSQPRILRSALSYNAYLLRLDPNNATAHTELGRALCFLDRPTEALPELQRAVELRPDDAEPHYYIGLVFRMQGRLEEAKTEFEKAARLNPDHFKAHGNLGLVLLEQGNLEAARPHFERALRINPNDTIARDRLEQIANARASAPK